MIELMETTTRRLSTRRSTGRVANALASFFRKQLSVPHVYLKPRIPGTSGIDLLAVDRAGSGDVHGVEIKAEMVLPPPAKLRAFIKPLLKPLNELPVHYRYLAFNTSQMDTRVLEQLATYEELFDPDGIGRVGILAYDDQLLQAEHSLETALVKLVVKPERFLVRGEKVVKLDKFLASARPDMEVRM